MRHVFDRMAKYWFEVMYLLEVWTVKIWWNKKFVVLETVAKHKADEWSLFYSPVPAATINS